MPSWSIHRFHAKKFTRELGIECSCVGLIDRLVDDPGATLPSVLEEVRRSSKLLALMLRDEAVRPEDPIAVHDWGAWRGFQASVDALRRVAEAVAGRTGPLMVDLHLSLDSTRLGCLEGLSSFSGCFETRRGSCRWADRPPDGRPSPIPRLRVEVGPRRLRGVGRGTGNRQRGQKLRCQRVC